MKSEEAIAWKTFSSRIGDSVRGPRRTEAAAELIDIDTALQLATHKLMTI